MTAIRKGKNGGSSFEEGARSAKPKNAVGFRLVQRKFAQGAPLPPPQPMAASPAPERRPDPPKEDQRMVYHNRMSAMNLLDMIALQKIHSHPPPGAQPQQQPTVRLERLRHPELPGPSAPARQERSRVALNTNKFKRRMCLRPRPGMSLRPGPARTNYNMHPSGVRPAMVREARMSTLSSTVSTSTTEDDMPLLFLRHEPNAEVSRVESIDDAASEDAEVAQVYSANRLSPRCCSALAYRSVQNIVTATTDKSNLLSRRCRECARCGVIKNIIKLSGLIQAAYRKRASVNDSNYEENHASREPLAEMRVTRPGQTQSWVFLDIFPRSYPKGLKIEYKPVGDDKMDATVYVVERRTMMDTSEVSFMEQQNVISNLLEHMEKQVEDQIVQDDQMVQVDQNGEPGPSTSRANVGTELNRKPKRKRVIPVLNQPSTSRAIMAAVRRLKRRRSEASQNSEARRQPLARKANETTHRPGNPYAPVNNKVDMQTQTMDTDGATSPTRLTTPVITLHHITVAPVAWPRQQDFQDPISYLKILEQKASEYGICKIVPPATFRPPCKLLGNNRFSVVYQYISKLYNRWGPCSRELAAIKAYLWLQNFTIRRPPIMECSEINLPKLHHVVERYGGVNKVVKYKRWRHVAEEMNLRQARTSERRLDQVFIQYLLPYASLSLDERRKKLATVDNGWTKKYQRIVKKAQKPFHKQERLLGEAVSSEEENELPEVVVALREAEDCIVPGRAMNLTVFKKVAETLRINQFGRDSVQTTDSIEEAYWKAVMRGDDHIVANAASIDTGDEGYGFPKYDDDGSILQPYNLKMIAKHPDNVLRFLGDLSGANNPTLHLNMLFSTSCWHRDPHRLPWIEYLHKGDPKIWYGIADGESENFRRAVQTLCPAFCQNKPLWLASDIAMIPPDILTKHNVHLTRTVQYPGEYVLVFPKAYSSSISTGFSVSESAYYASLDWLESAPTLFKGLRDSCEPSMFSLEQLLINGVSDTSTPRHLLLPMCSVLSTLISDELENRRLLALKGLKIDQPLPPKRGPSRRGWNNAPECEFCRCTLFLSGVVGLTGKRGAFCTEHALKLLDCGKYSHIVVSELEFRSNFKNVDLEQIIRNTEARVVKGG